MQKTIKALCIIIAIITVFSCTIKISFGDINEYISELNIVYTPTGPANRFHYDLSIDLFEYWVFNLTDKEEKLLFIDVENGNWSVLNSQHISKLETLEHYNEILGYSYKKHDCYICIYDYHEDKIITNSDNQIYYDTAGWIIFLYDTQASKYYCVFETM